MKRLLTSIIYLLLAVIPVAAQGIEFEPENTTLEQAAAKAKQQGKLVFLDCFTSWCGPCKMMARTIFTQKEVGDFMNPKYVSIKIDMESEYGAPLAKKLQISAYPTFVIFNADAQEIGRFVGGSKADEFMQRVTDKSKDNGSAALDARWNNGDRNPEFLMEYLNSLNASYKNMQANDVANAILEGKESTFAADSTLAMIFMRNIISPFSPSFIYTVKHPEQLTKTLGDVPVTMKLNSVWNNYQRQLIIEEGGTARLDEEKFNKYIALLKECNVPNTEHYRLTTLITLAEKQKDWKAYIGYINEYLACESIDADDMTLARWVKPFSAPDADATGKAEMTKILQARIAEIDAGKRESQTKMGNMQLSVPTRTLLARLVDALNGKPLH